MLMRPWAPNANSPTALNIDLMFYYVAINASLTFEEDEEEPSSLSGSSSLSDLFYSSIFYA